MQIIKDSLSGKMTTELTLMEKEKLASYMKSQSRALWSGTGKCKSPKAGYTATYFRNCQDERNEGKTSKYMKQKIDKSKRRNREIHKSWMAILTSNKLP